MRGLVLAFDWANLTSFVATGLTRGAIVALAALGFLLTYKATNVVNFAQGSLISMGAYAAAWFGDRGWPILFAYLGAIVFMFLVGVTIERVAYAPLRGRSVHVIVIATLGASIVIDTILALIFGATPKKLAGPVDKQNTFKLFGASILWHNVVVVVATLVVVGLMILMFQRTRFGRQLRAVAADRETARLYGVRVNLLSMLAFGLAAVLAAVAGILIAPLGSFDVSLGFIVMLGGFSAAILGGFGSLGGVVVGGFIIGFVQYVLASYNYFDWKVRDYQGIYPFLLMLLVIAFKPQGLFTKGEAHGRL